MLTFSLEIARGLAALWVFVYHMRLGLQPGPFRLLADAGFLGVPLFFVISGYCMMASCRGIIAKRQPAGTFLRRRLRRIFPPFWASILVALAVPFLNVSIAAAQGAGFHWPSPRWYEFSLVDWVALATLTRGVFRTGPTHLPYNAVNAVYWSLAIEVQFYLVLAVALQYRRRFLLWVSVVTAGSAAFWAIVGPEAPGVFVQYWPMFALGLLLYFVLEKGLRPARLFPRWTAPASAATGLALLAFMAWLCMSAPAEHLGRQTVFAALCAAVLWTASGVEPVAPKNFFVSRALVGLGKMSYSVYLLHLHMVSLVSVALGPLVRGDSFFNMTVRMSGALALTYVFYLACEKPFIASRPPSAAAVIPRPEPSRSVA